MAISGSNCAARAAWVGSRAEAPPRASSWPTEGSARRTHFAQTHKAPQKEAIDSRCRNEKGPRSRDETCAHSHGQGSMRLEPSLVGWQAKVLACQGLGGCSSAALRRAGQQSSQMKIRADKRRRAGISAPWQSPSMPTRTARRFFRRDSCARSSTSSTLKSPSRDAF